MANGKIYFEEYWRKVDEECVREWARCQYLEEPEDVKNAEGAEEPEESVADVEGSEDVEYWVDPQEPLVYNRRIVSVENEEALEGII